MGRDQARRHRQQASDARAGALRARSPADRGGAAMKTAAEILRENSIETTDTAPGRYYTTCPKCSAGRTRANQKKRCLGITINGDGVHFGCSHCGWKGGGYFNGKRNGKGSGKEIIDTYDYADENGALLFQVCRTADHQFPQRKKGTGGWVWSTTGVRKVLYRLPEVIEAISNGHRIVLAEGEKDVNALWDIGIPATCSPGGAAKPGQKPKWRPEYSEVLRGADVVVLGDHDEPGYAHQEATAKMSLGIARRVQVLKLAEHWPDCPEGGDVSDWLDAGHTREELDALIVGMLDYQDTPAQPARFTLTRFDKILFTTSAVYLVHGLVPTAGLTVVWGPYKCGKSFWTFDLFMHIALGWPYRGRDVRQGEVVYLALEGGLRFRHRVEAFRRKHST